MKRVDVLIIGGGPAGLAAGAAAKREGASVLLLEREEKLGGILKQCIHDGFGLARFKEKLSGPEYAYKEMVAFIETGAEYSLSSFVTEIKKAEGGYLVSYSTSEGMRQVLASKIILATGCRERSSRGVLITGDNPAGVMTAGQCQYYMNILGVMPLKKAVILGSGDIGLIMARRITLEGGEVLGVYEAKSTPSGLSRNIAQCLEDFEIPLHLSKTVTRTIGRDRLEAVEICSVDEKMRPIRGTEEIIECDALILSVGLIPENEVAEPLGVTLSPRTKGPYCDQTFMTLTEDIYSAGNALHVNDLADYVSESGEIAGRYAAKKEKKNRELKEILIEGPISYTVPSHIDCNGDTENIILYFRVTRDIGRAKLIVKSGEKILFKKNYQRMRPPEMERICFSAEDKEQIAISLQEAL